MGKYGDMREVVERNSIEGWREYLYKIVDAWNEVKWRGGVYFDGATKVFIPCINQSQIREEVNRFWNLTKKIGEIISNCAKFQKCRNCAIRNKV